MRFYLAAATIAVLSVLAAGPAYADPETEPNDDGAVSAGGGTVAGNDFSAINANGPFTRSVTITAAINPAGDEDGFAFRNNSSKDVELRLETWSLAAGRGIGYKPCGIDTVLHVRNAAGASLAMNDDRPGDGCSALVFILTPGQTVYAHVLEYGDNGTIPSYALQAVFPPAAGTFPDFNADGHPDIVWSNTANGATYVWHMGSPPPALISDAFVAQIDPSWTVQGIWDFNGDGKPDLVWRNRGNGNTYVWYMDGATFLSDALLFSLPPEWVIQGVADFNRDGKPDFLMRNTDPRSGVAFVWFFDGSRPIGDQFLFGIDPTWKVEAVADLNGDGQPDLLFRNVNPESGLAFVWNTQYSDNTLLMASSSPPIFSIHPDWEVVQLEDWDGDGMPDLLFRNMRSGVVFVWYLRPDLSLGANDFIVQIDPVWEIVPRR